MTVLSTPPSTAAVSSGDKTYYFYWQNMDQGVKGKMSSSDSNLLNVPSPRKPSEAKSVDSGSNGPSREPSTSLLRTNSSLPIIEEKIGGISKESLSSSCMSSSFASIAEDEAVSSEPHRLQFINISDYQRMALIEASQPSIMQLNESHVSLSLTFSSSGYISQKSMLHITVTSSGESQSQPDNKSVAKSSHSTSLTVEQEDILRRTVVKKTHVFTERTNFVTLLPYLFEKKLVHPGECERLEKFSSHKEKGNHFYTVILPQKGKHAYRRFYKCLKKETEHLGHRDLVEILDRALEEQQSPQSSSDSSPTTENSSDHVDEDRPDDSSNPGNPSTLNVNVNSSSSADTLIDDRRHGLSRKCGDNSQMHIMSSHPIASCPSDDGNEGKCDPAPEEVPLRHKASSRNSQTINGCCIIL